MYSYSYSIATYFVYIAMLGLNNYGNRSIAACQDDREKRSKVFCSIYAMQVLCFFLSMALYLVYAVLLAENTIVAALQGLYVLSALFDINWFFFGMEKFKLTVMRNALVKAITTVLIFIFVRSASDIDLYIGIMCSGFLVSQLCLWPFLFRYIDFRRPNLKDVVSHIKPNLTLFIPVIAVSVYTILSKIILGQMAGQDQVGFFETAAQIAAVPVALVTAVGSVMLPRSSALRAQGKHEASRVYMDATMLLVVAFTALAGFGMPMIASPFSEAFYGPGFEMTGCVLVILSATIPLLGFGNVLRSQYLIPSGHDSIFLWSAVLGAIANLTINIALIPRFGALGAAWASLGAEVVVVVYQTAKIRKEVPIKRYLGYAAVFCAIGAFMDAILAVLSLPPVDPWVDIILTIAIGFGVYAPLAILAIALIKKRMDSASLA